MRIPVCSESSLALSPRARTPGLPSHFQLSQELSGVAPSLTRGMTRGRQLRTPAVRIQPSGECSLSGNSQPEGVSYWQLEGMCSALVRWEGWMHCEQGKESDSNYH